MASKEEYEELAKEMKLALGAARTIPMDVLGMSMKLTAEDYRAIASGLFIQAFKNKNGGNYSGPSTESQLLFIAGLAQERDGTTDVIRQFLDTHELQGVEQLNSSQASTLSDLLKELPKRK